MCYFVPVFAQRQCCLIVGIQFVLATLGTSLIVAATDRRSEMRRRLQHVLRPCNRFLRDFFVQQYVTDECVAETVATFATFVVATTAATVERCIHLPNRLSAVTRIALLLRDRPQKRPH